MEADGISYILNITMVAFGNAYYITDPKICGGTKPYNYNWTSFSEYDNVTRTCFNQKCGNDNADEGCFTGVPYCQHGGAECSVNLLQMCSVNVSANWTKHLPFALCLEGKYDEIAKSVKYGNTPNMTFINSTVKECADKHQFDGEAVLKCFSNDAAEIYKKAAKATPPHEGTPYVTITQHNGSFVFNTSDTKKTSLLEAVCEAWDLNDPTKSHKVPGCPAKKDADKKDMVKVVGNSVFKKAAEVLVV